MSVFKPTCIQDFARDISSITIGRFLSINSFLLRLNARSKSARPFYFAGGFRYTIFNVPSHPDRRKITMTRSWEILRVCLNIDHMIEFVEDCTTRRIVSSFEFDERTTATCDKITCE